MLSKLDKHSQILVVFPMGYKHESNDHNMISVFLKLCAPNESIQAH